MTQITPLAPEGITLMFTQLRSITDEVGHDLLDILERRLLLDEMWLTKLGAGNDDFSRKVPDTPGLRLVGGDL